MYIRVYIWVSNGVCVCFAVWNLANCFSNSVSVLSLKCEVGYRNTFRATSHGEANFCGTTPDKCNSLSPGFGLFYTDYRLLLALDGHHGKHKYWSKLVFYWALILGPWTESYCTFGDNIKVRINRSLFTIIIANKPQPWIITIISMVLCDRHHHRIQIEQTAWCQL